MIIIVIMMTNASISRNSKNKQRKKEMGVFATWMLIFCFFFRWVKFFICFSNNILNKIECINDVDDDDKTVLCVCASTYVHKLFAHLGNMFGVMNSTKITIYREKNRNVWNKLVESILRRRKHTQNTRRKTRHIFGTLEFKKKFGRNKEKNKRIIMLFH